MKLVPLALAAIALGAAAPGLAQTLPMSAPPAPPIPEPKDVPFPGVIQLKVDATDTDRKIFRVHETIPVKPGPMILLYPKWLPGNHSPTGAVDKVAGLIITANGQRVEWRRDPVDVFAFHVDVPAGASTLDVDFQFLSPTDTREGRVVMTPAMLNLEWNQVSLYPAGYYARDIQVEATAVLPEGWKFGTALEQQGAPRTDGTYAFKAVPYDVLIDSPMYVGKYFEQLDLDPGAAVPVHMDIVADHPDELVYKPEVLEAHRNLIKQAYKLYGSHHYNHYDFLVSFSDEMSGQGLEHHRSSEDGTSETYFTDWDKSPAGHDLLSHEYTHSWDGKFRRPADLWTPNYDVPMRDSLLWVYEGQTQYWGYVLAARAGMDTKQGALDSWAAVAATYDHVVGRDWKALQDTTNDPITARRAPQSWRSWQRSEDYYFEGALIWLDADTLIREMSHGKKSLDDFARTFFGVDDGAWGEKTYTFDDVVAALNAVQPYDWKTFLRTRLDGHGPGAPLDGIKRSGYKLVYTDVESASAKAAAARRHSTDFMYSLGFSVDKDGKLQTVQWDGPAFKAGLIPGTQILAVDGRAYDGDVLKQAVKDAKGAGPAIDLIVKNGEHFRTVRLDWHEGLKYPHLERDGTAPAALDAILAAKP